MTIRRLARRIGAALVIASSGAVTTEATGQVHFPISCSDQARAEFDRGVALLHHMTYPEARISFERVEALDPRCAMAGWGVAMTLFQPLWPTRPGPDDLRRGSEAVRRARSLGPPTERERLYLAAAEAFFQDPASSDYWLRIRRWERAQAAVYDAFPDDPDATAFYALAHLAVAPASGNVRAHADRAAELLLAVHRRHLDHPGALHYLVHANDVSGREGQSLEIVGSYATSAPRNPHALHMPTHIYTRLGDWPAVIRGNLLAADAALEHPAGDSGQLVWDEFPHAIEYLVYAYLQQGADREAAAQLERLVDTPRLEPSFKTAFHLASTRARFALERHAWSEAERLVAREPAGLDWDRFAWPEAVTRFGIGLGAARQGRLDPARRAARRLLELEATAAGAGEDIFARNIRLLALELDAWLAHRDGHRDSSLAWMSRAVELELSTPKHAVTPGPTLPAHELLGDLLMERQQPAEALAAYRRSLELYPKRFNSLLGAARAARALGDDPAARALYRELLAVAAPLSPRRTALEEARSFASPPS